MQYTKNYRLPQWVSSDRIMMEDFNEMNGSIEEGLTETAAQAAEARATANAASQNAANAQQSVKTWKNYVAGSYIGNGETKDISLGFRPSFVIACGSTSTGNNDAEVSRFFLMTAGSVCTARLRFTANGFQVLPIGSGVQYPEMNQNGRTYDYIAFR